MSSETSSTVDIPDIIGKTINQYMILGYISSGTYSHVFMAYHMKTDTIICMKRSIDGRYHENVVEAYILYELATDKLGNLPAIHEHFIFQSHMYIIMDMYDNNLRTVINSDKYHKGLPLPLLKTVVHQICRALDVVHNRHNLIHGDIKPANIYLKDVAKVQDKQEQILKIKSTLRSASQEKIARKVEQICKRPADDDEDTRECQYLFSGTKHIKYVISHIHNPEIVLADYNSASLDTDDFKPHIIQPTYYRAPEVTLVNGYSKKCDIWALGCVIYELFTGDTFLDDHSFDDKDETDAITHIKIMEHAVGEKVPQSMITSCGRGFLFESPTNKLSKIQDLQLLELLTGMLRINPDDRWNVRQCLASPFLSGFIEIPEHKLINTHANFVPRVNVIMSAVL